MALLDDGHEQIALPQADRNTGDFKGRTLLVYLAGGLVFLFCVIGGWEALARANAESTGRFPAPSDIWKALQSDGRGWLSAMLFTLDATVGGLVIVAIGELLHGISKAGSRIDKSPPLIRAMIGQWVAMLVLLPALVFFFDAVYIAMVICAWTAAVLTLVLGILKSRQALWGRLEDVFNFYHASWWQRFSLLMVPLLMPHLVSRMRIAAPIGLVGALAAEFVAAAAGKTSGGIGYQVLEAGSDGRVAELLAALIVVVLTGAALSISFCLLSALAKNRA